MEILRHVDRHRPSIPHPVLAMGNFDGIHLGHQALLGRVIEDARALRGRSVVLTFEPHPLKVLAPAAMPELILTHRDKMLLLASIGIDIVVIQPFDTAFANLEPGEFVQRYLVQLLGIRKIWVGKDFGFGKGRKGRIEDLIGWGAKAGFEVGTFDAVERGGKRVSSSRIRELIKQGKVEEVPAFMGRFHFVSGRVRRGHQRGRLLGFPTANIASRNELLPRDGIYATLFEVGGGRWPSVTSIGRNPTFGEGPRTIEAYIFDFEGDLYGKRGRVFFARRIRDEKKFASPELLVEQMKADVRDARRALAEL